LTFGDGGVAGSGFGISSGRGFGGAPPAPAAVNPSFRAAAKATTPPTQTTGNSGGTVVIPVPTGTQNGDMMIAVVTYAVGGSVTVPSGWTAINVGTNFLREMRSYFRVASSEPASYTWTFGSPDFARNGVMVSIKDANATLGANAVATGFTVPSLSVTVDGSLLVAFAAAETTTYTPESFLSTSPLTERSDHICNGSAAYNQPNEGTIATEANLLISTISGRNFTNALSDNFENMAGGVIVRPA
jgi:hypothetical protein